MTVPSVNTHLTQARANRDHAEWLLATSPSDPTARQWVVTATFYSALHGLTAYLMRQGVAVKSHSARAKALADPNNGVPQAVQDAYRRLEERSRGARYDLRFFAAHDVRNLLDQDLAAIAAFTGM
jgi:uncharacterized protein (UPF0332 family)